MGLLKGEVCTLADDLKTSLKVPHIGWNRLNILEKDSLRRDAIFQGIQQGDHVYYVHSFYAKGCEESLLATSDYEVLVPGVVKRENIFGMQFHPEKSGKVGLELLKKFAEKC